MRAEVEAAEQFDEQCGSFSLHEWGTISKRISVSLIKTFQGGLFSNNETINPDFWDFNVVLGYYCSSDYWSGTISNSSVGGWSFLGSNHVPAMASDLTNPAIIPYPNLVNATELLFGGSSAGGEGAFQNANRFKSLTPWIPKIRVAIDSG